MDQLVLDQEQPRAGELVRGRELDQRVLGADAGGRATYGMSPGDHSHDEPYLYVGAWGDVDATDPYWNETAFNGASMSYAELLTHDDPYEAALGFFRSGYEKLAAQA